MRTLSNGIQRYFIVFAALALPSLANSQAVTYDFTGVVTSTYGIYNVAGSTITGTYVFDTSVVSPESFGTVGDTTTQWEVHNSGGAAYGSPTPSSLVFGLTLAAGSVSYNSTTPSTSGIGDLIQGYNDAGFSAPNHLYLANVQYFSDSSYVQSYVNLSGGTGINAPFNSNGLPVLANAAYATGEVDSNANGTVNGMLLYNITSLTPAPTSAPEMDPASAASGLTLLLGGLMVLRGRRGRDALAEAVPTH
jgi:hypothetical protein